MKRRVVVGFVLLVAVSLTTARGDEGVMDRVLSRFAAAVTFHLSFDDASAGAELSCGEAKPREAQVRIEQRPGLVGNAFLSGGQGLSFPAAGNIDLSRSGALCVWISAHEWPAQREEVPYLFFINVVDHGRNLMLARMGQKANHEAVYLYAKTGIGLSARGGDSLAWKNGEWHLLVANWRSDSIEFSLDGREFLRRDLPAFTQGDEKPGLLLIGGKGDPRHRYLMDELMVFNRPLEAPEVRWLIEMVR